MYVLDITSLQRCPAHEATALLETVRQNIVRLKEAGVEFRCLIRDDVENFLALNARLTPSIDPESYLHLDLAALDELLSSDILARFMVTQGIQYWCLLEGGLTSVPLSTLHQAALQAGVHVGLALDLEPEFLAEDDTGQKVLLAPNKPTLAIVAPFPPTKSGIADYVARQVPYLQQYYQLVLVDENPQDSTAQNPFPGERVSPRVFLETPELHQRVLYHLGNSPTHLTALKLLAQVPGLVVLHDFFLSDVQQYEDIILNRKDRATFNELIYSHGYRPLLEVTEKGNTLNLSDYPCNLKVIEQARKVLLHSRYGMAQAETWYGNRIKQHLGQIGFARDVLPAVDRVASRAALGYSPETYLVGTFGFATPAKCLETLINAWATSKFANKKNACLVIAGEFLDERYQSRIHQLLDLRQCTNVQLLGYLTPEEYALYLSSVDLAVQLRTRSRGETSAALLDCLASGTPVIANNHGFVEDLPEQILWKTKAQPDVSELVAVLEQLSKAKFMRQTLSDNALEYLRQVFDPPRVAEQLFQEIEATATRGVCLTADAIARQIGRMDPPLSDAQRMKVAQALEYNRLPGLNRQLLIDVTVVARNDLRTGIQRVVRALLREFIIAPPNGYRILPIYLDPEGSYRYAHQFMLKMLDQPLSCLEDQVVEVHAGDVYLGLDLHTTTMVRHASVYEEWRKRGVRIVNVLYDLLPVHAPQWFPAMVEPDFKAWLCHIVFQSDQVIAISRTVADDLSRWVASQKTNESRALDLEIGWFHLGADLDATVPSKGLPDNAASKLQKFAKAPSFLMVGTIEPRKGHAQTLNAFEVLWAQGYEYNLVIVGKEGWQMQHFIKRLHQHPELNKRLHWLEGISDEYLEQIYPCCTALIAASEGEGFGLPLIEAARHRIPVLARDIEIFREVGGDGAYFFEPASAEHFAEEIQDWVNLPEGNKPDVGLIKTLTWQESALQLKAVLNLSA